MSIVVDLHELYVRGTQKKAIVKIVQALLCHLTATVVKGVGLACTKVYVNTRVLKHGYDKRTAQDYDMLIEHLREIVKFPSRVYRNKGGKRGSYCFVKTVNNIDALVSIETTETEDGELICEVATFFVPGEKYLEGFELLWEWKDGNPSS